MTLVTQWEHQLIEKATVTPAHDLISSFYPYDKDILNCAYQLCAEITSQHSKTFYLTSSLLSLESQKAVRALYAFCRISDNIADDEADGRLAKLQTWSQRSLTNYPPIEDLVPLAWANTRAKYGIPREYAEQLLEGVTQDLTKTRYENFAELAHYCYGVASTVGLMTMHIIGFSSPEAIPLAIKLGIALQLTNILRDVGEDWERGRLYLPQDELYAYGLCEDDIAAGEVNPNWRAFMRFQIGRARKLYAESMPGIALLGRKGQFAIQASAELYREILREIERNDYDVFTRRAYVSTGKKLFRLPSIWWRTGRT